MKKLIVLCLVLSLLVSFCTVSASALDENDFEHPKPPEFLCDCDNPMPGGVIEIYRAMQPDLSDEIYHYFQKYEVRRCGECNKYVYEFLIDDYGAHHFEDGICKDCGYER